LEDAMLETRTEIHELGLGRTQIDQFWEDGFIVVDGVIPGDEVERLREACLAPAIVAQGERDDNLNKTVHYLDVTPRHPAFLELCLNPAVVEKVKSLIGADLQLQHSKLAAQAGKKGKGGFSWHQDFAFFPHTNTDLVAVMIMLDDATLENGCMSMIKGSHRLGLLEHRADGVFTGACQEKRHWEDHPELITPVTPKAGGISIHHCLTLHGSGPNLSGQPRRGIVYQYRADDAYQLADTIFLDTGLLVSGRRRGLMRLTPGIYYSPDWAPERHEGEFALQVNQRASGE
jgi:ectoine hydroxylase-related dioxygenase (phytanoyl-CoA dioxygenase family)